MMRRRRPVRDDRRADAILIADLHLTETPPVARTDDYHAAMARKFEFIQGLVQIHGCPIICAGDVFDRWKASPWLLQWALQHLPHPMVTIPGNHDLPMRSLEHFQRAALYVLGVIDTLYNVGHIRVYAANPLKFEIAGRQVLILHELVFPQSYASFAETAGGLTPRKVIEKYGDHYDLILTGDNHMPFVERVGDTLLVNPGSLMRITAAQVDHRPRCYLYYAEDNSVVPVYIPIEEGVISREHLERREERERRVEAYIERMQTDFAVGLSFRQNLEAFFEKNNTPKTIRDLIWEHLEEGMGNEAGHR